MKALKALTLNSTPEEKLAALRSTAKKSNSDFTYLICRDGNGKLLSVSVHAEAEFAAALLQFLKSKKIADL